MRPSPDPGPCSLRCVGIVLLYLVSIGVVVAFPIWCCMAYASLGALGESHDDLTREDVESYGRIHLPPDVRDLQARWNMVITKQWLLARFSIAPGDLPDLLASGGFPAPKPGPIPCRSSPGREPDWWTPETARSYLRSEIDRGEIIVVTDRPDRHVVYLVRRW